MLHWLAGQKPSEGAQDPDATGYMEPPETPAPVFAVRAFKHAIFGTPQTVQPKPRRHSNTENARPRNHENRPSRPVMARPKSAGDAQGLGKENDDPLIPEPVASPTKGILMTPGTAAAKRKTVTFGDGVADNDEKRPTKSGLPDDYPGKFPSPWASSGANEVNGDSPTEGRKGKSKLTEALEQAREESAKKHRSKRQAMDIDDDVPREFTEPKSESGKYWKAQYDAYRQNTQREVRKLITKQKAAKSFAKEKDFQCTELADDLRREKKKVERLERRTADLEAQLKELQQKLHSSRGSAQNTEQSVTQSQREPKSDPERPKPNESRRSAATSTQGSRPVQAQSMTEPQPAVTKPPMQSPAEPIEPVKQQRAEVEPPKPRPRLKPETVRARSDDDIWAQSLNSSSQLPSKVPEKPPLSPQGGRVVTSGTDLTPLKSLSINTLPAAKLVRRDSAQPSPPADRAAKPPFTRQNSIPSPVQAGTQNESALSPAWPLPSPEPASTRQESPTPRGNNEVTEQISLPPPASSPFQPMAALSPPPKQSKHEQQGQASADAVSRKENTSPNAKSITAPATLRVKPSAAWNAINAPAAGKRVTSLVDKTGKEVGVDRLEAAKARIAARGRVVS